MKKVLSLILVALMLLSSLAVLASCGNNEDTKKLGVSADVIPEIALDVTGITVPDDFKLGVICLHDENSTYDLNFINAVKRVQAALGLKDSQVIFKKGINEDATCTTAANELVEAGCKIVFADSYGHQSYLLEAAKAHPEVEFCHATGDTAHTDGYDNFHNAFASIYEGRFLAGIVAGEKLLELKKAGKLKGDHPVIGYVGAYTYAEVISGYTSFYLGAKYVCPDVTMKVQFTGSWYDETEEKSAAEALIAAGCDLISQHADSHGAPTACEDNNIPNVSYNGSTYDDGENTFLISSRIDWSPYFLYIIKQFSNGEDIATDWTGTINTGSVLLSGLNLDVVAEGTKEKLDEVIAKMKKGEFNVFDTNTFTVNNGQKVTSYMANVDPDPNFAGDTEVIENGVFVESKFRSAPYFDLKIDNIELLNEKM